MSRQLRVCFSGAWYHVMNRGVNHQRIFYNDRARKAFLEYIAKTVRIYGIELHAYCLMDNHYHLIIHTPRGNISCAMRYLNSSYARYVNVVMKRDGSLFKGRFKSILVSNDEYLIKLSKYIHLNPREAKITNDVERYKWSSYQHYLNGTKKPSWLVTTEIVNRFGAANFSSSYKTYVEFKSNKDLDELYNNYQSSPVYSNDEFRKLVDEYVRSHSLSAEIVGADRILIPPSMREIIHEVAAHFKIDPRVICERANSRLNQPRRIAMYICREMGGYSLREIGVEMANVSYKTVSSSIERIKKNNYQMRIAEEIIRKINKMVKRMSSYRK